MYGPTILQLKQFYATPLGQCSWRIINSTIAQFWPVARKETIIGAGFATPYLERYRDHNNHMIALMPASQGALYWPALQPNRSALMHESDWPVANQSINRILLVHCVEHTDRLPLLMKELWRVLQPGGRILMVLPHRRGIWNRGSHTPFGDGRPYSLSQIKALLENSRFTFMDARTTLHTPPFTKRMLLRTSPVFELLGAMFCPFFGGVIVVEAEKQIYASLKKPVENADTLRQAMPAIQGAMSHLSR